MQHLSFFSEKTLSLQWRKHFFSEMRLFFSYILPIISMGIFFTSCEDDPVSHIKPLADRQILVMTKTGEIFDHNHKSFDKLPDCDIISEIITDGNDYFVSGSHQKGKVGYWKNGEWNTLHIDFIDEVEHFTSGIAKWDSYIYLFDYPNVLKNSGIFPLQHCGSFFPARRCMTVSEGNCFVVGSKTDHKLMIFRPVLYYEVKGEFVGEILPDAVNGIKGGECCSVYAYDRTHTIIGGNVGREAAVWVDKVLQILPRTYNVDADGSVPNQTLGRVSSVVRCDGRVCAGGFEVTDKMNKIATLWVDGVPQHLQSGREYIAESEVDEMICYDKDLYVMTYECLHIPNNKKSVGSSRSDDDDEDDEPDFEVVDRYVIWLNGMMVVAFEDLNITDFAII